jgi:hypothetical protein
MKKLLPMFAILGGLALAQPVIPPCPPACGRQLPPAQKDSAATVVFGLYAVLSCGALLVLGKKNGL